MFKLKSLKTNFWYHLLVLIIIVLIIVDFDVPLEVSNVLNHPIGFGVLLLGGIYLFFVHKLLGVVALFFLYELSRRMTSHTTPFRHYVGNDRESHLSAYNQFEPTLEEDIVKELVPMVSEMSMGMASFEPVVDKSITASTL
jgi:hypothetical protein